MDTINERIKRKRAEIRLSQRALASRLGVTHVAISRWELGHSQPKGKNLLGLSKIFKCSPRWLESGDERSERSVEGIIYALVPFYADVEIAAGVGCFGNESFEQDVIPIPNYVLDQARVSAEQSICVKVKGDSMFPALTSGAIIGVDTSNTSNISIEDGKIYVLCQDGLLRVKLLYRYPNGIKLRSYNSFYEDEMYTNEDVNNIKIIGKVFWASSILT